MKKILIMGLVWAASIPFILAQKGIDLRPYVYVQMEKGAERIIELKCSHPLIGDDYIFIYFKQLDDTVVQHL